MKLHTQYAIFRIRRIGIANKSPQLIDAVELYTSGYDTEEQAHEAMLSALESAYLNGVQVQMFVQKTHCYID